MQCCLLSLFRFLFEYVSKFAVSRIFLFWVPFSFYIEFNFLSCIKGASLSLCS
uniref:Uncharacterized protein n=1 Tax=Rhizophora mucronata TaxID=61149 RepID=A0A2P2J3Y7_RHIMU